jgi:hypothetical protein
MKGKYRDGFSESEMRDKGWIEQRFIQVLVGKRKETDHLEETDVDERII